MERLDQLQNDLPCDVDIVHVDVCRKPLSSIDQSAISEYVEKVLLAKKTIPRKLFMENFGDDFMKEHVKSVKIVDENCRANETFDPHYVHMSIHVYQLHHDAPGEEEVEDEEISAAIHWMLPSVEYDGLWDSLIYDSSIKTQLLDYVGATIMFSERKVDPHIISWNKVILLHGPPGTGKTSLCKALAQKICIRLSHKYTYGQLIEINSHSLFSKWFSESGKLVMKMFSKIQELIDDKDALVFVLIDEVESLTAARKSALAGSEPSDAIRVVNAVLTQLDQIKRNPNVIILTTSNITGAIDLAFVDRADIKQYIGLPSPAAIYQIYFTCIVELMKVAIITPNRHLLSWSQLDQLADKSGDNDLTRLSMELKEVATASEGLSGRTLRKIPFISLAIYVRTSSTNLDNFLVSLKKAVVKQFEEREELCDTR